MALFVIGDPHLSLGTEKPMDIFAGWGNYVDRLTAGWRGNVKEEDTVVIPGDISWAMRLEDAFEDFRLLDSLPGRKILLKGNHDYWWITRRKLDNWCAENGFNSIHFLFNDAYLYERTALCGTRSWFYDAQEAQDDKVFQRELGRLRASLQAAGQFEHDEVFAFLHYPPVFSGAQVDPILDLLREYRVSRCFYGHVHGKSIGGAFNGVLDGIRFQLVSADYLKFIPYRIL